MQGSNGSSERGRGIVKLGHVGLYVHDLPMMRDWYRDTLGLTVTDQDVDGLGIVFLSSRPDEEHHELALQSGRATDKSVPMVQQVSWLVESLEDVRAFHYLLKERNIPVQQEVTHGNAFGIYFFDPEGNRLEVYCHTGQQVPQPYRKTINFEQPVEAIQAEHERLMNDGGPAYQPVTTRPS
jgi:catechol-2,3-dioxygenase